MSFLIAPEETPNGIGIRYDDHGRLEALSGCCEAPIHAHPTWHCSSCSEQVLGENSDVYASAIRAMESRQDYARVWVAFWTGFQQDNISVSIRS